MKPEALKARADAIRLPIRDLARRSGLDEMTVHRILKGQTDPRWSSLVAIDRVLSEAEGELRASLPAVPLSCEAVK